MFDLTKYIIFDERLLKLRTERGMKQTDVAAKLSVSKQSVANWENGNIMPSVEMLVKIASLFSVTTDYLLGLDNKQHIEITGLPEKYVAHLQQLAEDLAEKSAMVSA